MLRPDWYRFLSPPACLFRQKSLNEFIVVAGDSLTEKLLSKNSFKLLTYQTFLNFVDYMYHVFFLICFTNNFQYDVNWIQLERKYPLLFLRDWACEIFWQQTYIDLAFHQVQYILIINIIIECKGYRIVSRLTRELLNKVAFVQLIIILLNYFQHFYWSRACQNAELA